tara:strand:+ start:363 stop:569 length:207 start_codon:yes stop_codon:yes gene_type:complete
VSKDVAGGACQKNFFKIFMKNFSKDVVHISQIKLSFFPEKLFYLSFHRTTSYTPRAHRHLRPHALAAL